MLHVLAQDRCALAKICIHRAVRGAVTIWNGDPAPTPAGMSYTDHKGAFFWYTSSLLPHRKLCKSIIIRVVIHWKEWKATYLMQPSSQTLTDGTPPASAEFLFYFCISLVYSYSSKSLMSSSKQISQTACNRAHTSITGVKQDTFQWSIKQNSFTLTSYRCPKEQATFLSGILVPASYGISLGEERMEKRRYFPLLLSSSNSEISKILTLSTTPFRFTINNHLFSENKMGIFWSLLTLFSFKILKNKTNYNQL